MNFIDLFSWAWWFSLGFTQEWFETILEVEKEHKDKLENLTAKQWMDLVHKFVDKIFVEEDILRVVMRVGMRVGKG